jgi:hypothetical protein
MSAPMVRAILDGSKTQTRRIIKADWMFGPDAQGYLKADDIMRFAPMTGHATEVCPLGQPGDRLWVKETHWRFGRWQRNGLTNTRKQRWRFRAQNSGAASVCYEPPHIIPNRTSQGWHKRPSIFMPRWASRITLEITGVRVERLQDISEEDARTEGCEPLDASWECSIAERVEHQYDEGSHHKYKNGYHKLWESIHGKGSWERDKNKWVWVLEFKRLTERPNE